MRADNSGHLVAAARQRHEQTRIKAIAALHDLDQTGSPITFGSVADHAGVSRSWLYTQTDLKDEIRRLRALQQPKAVEPQHNHDRASHSSLRRRLSLAHQRIHELDDENRRLRNQVAQLHGQLRASRLGGTSTTPSTTQTR
ncbi:DUF6262 family protein [Nocardia sp. CA-107356]|uniref:DUF6262 family protein n=1 Tax=Nocardia sp. CA-107356 TaxID=3239972 RepID=UPI003D8B6C87